MQLRDEWIVSKSTPEYFKKFHELFVQETNRVADYLHESTKAPLQKACVKVMLDYDTQIRLLQNEDSGLFQLLKMNKLDDVALMYSCIEYVDKFKLKGGLSEMAKIFGTFIEKEGDILIRQRLKKIDDMKKKIAAMPKHKQQRIAQESLEIYAPIASRLGMSEIKGELEDASFAYLLPQDYERMKSIMDIKVREKGAYVSRIIDKTEKLLQETNVAEFQVHGRVKRLYSLHKKLNRYQGDLSKVYDLIAVRIIVQDVEECYIALGLLHRSWRPVPGRIKDYIAQPKPNGYQSLHTTVFTENGEIVEFQIRTVEMHELAEYGVAAHWRYKNGGKQLKNTRWMEELAMIQKELANKKEFMEQLEIMKIDVFKDRIFVFTPQGDVIDLPEGATPIDFAYAIHTEVGNKCTAARVNDIMRNLDTPLTSGDIVEITTDKNRRGPNPDWMKFAKTRHARIKIKDATKHTVKGWFAEVLKGREKAKK